MPNHVMNRLEFDCPMERLREILGAICYDGGSEEAERTGIGTIDFNKIIPMPATLNIEAGSRTMDGVNLYLTSLNPDAPHFGSEKMDPEAFSAFVQKIGKTYGFGSRNHNLSEEEIAKVTQYTSAEELLELGKTAVHNQLQYGATTWYDWRIQPDHWNTKWNSYDPGDYDGGREITFQTAWCPPHPIIQKLSEMYPEVTIRHAWANEDLSADAGELYYEGGQKVDGHVPISEEETRRMAINIWDWDPEEVEDINID